MVAWPASIIGEEIAADQVRQQFGITVPTSSQEVALLRWDGSMWVDVTPTAAATGSLSYTTNALGQFALVTRPTTTAQSGIYLPILLR